MAWADSRALVVTALLLSSCDQGKAGSASARPAPETHASAPSASGAPASSQTSVPAPPLERKSYAWLDDAALSPPKAVDTLHARFSPPDGFTRVALAEKSFGAWLRELPLAAAGTPVRAYDGRTLHPADDPRISAVIALDVSKADLQQCADTVIRLHAEWSWTQGRRDMSYRAASGMPLAYERWAKGDRLVPEGNAVAWAPGSAKPSDDHASFRKYLDAVFAWANTVSLERQAAPVKAEAVRPGDFFIWPGNPGHAVLVLDLVTRGDVKLALLGQSYMPAQNAQVLALRGNPWFRLDPSQDVDTPFWQPFPWKTLHRLDP